MSTVNRDISLLNEADQIKYRSYFQWLNCGDPGTVCVDIPPSESTNMFDPTYDFEPKPYHGEIWSARKHHDITKVHELCDIAKQSLLFVPKMNCFSIELIIMSEIAGVTRKDKILMTADITRGTRIIGYSTLHIKLETESDEYKKKAEAMVEKPVACDSIVSMSSQEEMGMNAYRRTVTRQMEDGVIQPISYNRFGHSGSSIDLQLHTPENEHPEIKKRRLMRSGDLKDHVSLVLCSNCDIVGIFLQHKISTHGMIYFDDTLRNHTDNAERVMVIIDEVLKGCFDNVMSTTLKDLNHIIRDGKQWPAHVPLALASSDPELQPPVVVLDFAGPFSRKSQTAGNEIIHVNFGHLFEINNRLNIDTIRESTLKFAVSRHNKCKWAEPNSSQEDVNEMEIISPYSMDSDDETSASHECKSAELDSSQENISELEMPKSFTMDSDYEPSASHDCNWAELDSSQENIGEMDIPIPFSMDSDIGSSASYVSLKFEKQSTKHPRLYKTFRNWIRNKLRNIRSRLLRCL